LPKLAVFSNFVDKLTYQLVDCAGEFRARHLNLQEAEFLMRKRGYARLSDAAPSERGDQVA
jgi:hypothetical protein